MNTLKLLTLVLGLFFAYSLGCGSNNPVKNGAGGSIGPMGTGGAGLGGQGGSPSVDAAADAPIDAPASVIPEGGPGIDTAPRETGPATPFVNCTGLTKEQCHDLIINPPLLPDGVLPLDPGPPPSIPYPSCTAT
jgi:hypothetical protein